MGMSPTRMIPRASGFNPKSIAGLSLWLDPNDATTLTIDTGVSVWADKSGKGNNLTQSTGNNQPTLTTINGKTALSFNGTSQRISRTSSFLAGNCSFAIFVVMEGTFPGTAARVLDSLDTSATDFSHLNIELRADQGAAWSFGTLRSRVQSARNSVVYNADQRFDSVNVSGVGLVSCVGSFGLSSSTNTTYWKNSAAPSSSGTSNGGTAVGFALGCRNNATQDSFYTGKLGEILIYVNAISASQQADIQRYLAKKWGFTLS